MTFVRKLRFRFSIRSLLALIAIVAFLVFMYPAARNSYIRNTLFHSPTSPSWWPSRWVERDQLLQSTFFVHEYDASLLLNSQIAGHPAYTTDSLELLLKTTNPTSDTAFPHFELSFSPNFRGTSTAP